MVAKHNATKQVDTWLLLALSLPCSPSHLCPLYPVTSFSQAFPSLPFHIPAVPFCSFSCSCPSLLRLSSCTFLALPLLLVSLSKQPTICHACPFKCHGKLSTLCVLLGNSIVLQQHVQPGRPDWKHVTWPCNTRFPWQKAVQSERRVVLEFHGTVI